MSVEKSLIQLILDLLKDPKLLAEFKDDPQALLASCGLSGVSPEDVRDAIVLAQDNDDVSFDREYNTGGGSGGHTPPPPPVATPKPGETDQEAAIKYIDKYVTTNNYTYNVDDRDTIIDQSINQNIDTGGGDFEQSIENNSVNATGDGAVAAGGDIEAPVTTGDGNVVGDDNKVVSGDDNVSSFGTGSAVSDVSVDDGGAFSVNGPASGDDSVNDSYNDVDTTTTTSNEYDYDDSFNQTTENSVTTEIETTNDTHILSGNEASIL